MKIIKLKVIFSIIFMYVPLAIFDKKIQWLPKSIANVQYITFSYSCLQHIYNNEAYDANPTLESVLTLFRTTKYY